MITEKRLDETIDRVVKEVLDEHISIFNKAFSRLSRKDKKASRSKWGENMHGADRNHKRLRADIADWLKNPQVDCAEIAKELWPHKQEDSRRSYFYKCRDNKTYTVHHKKRRYDFTNAEYRKLYSIMTSSPVK